MDGSFGKLKGSNNTALILLCLMTALISKVAFSSDPAEVTTGRISVSSFGAIPDDGQNDAVQLRKAIDYCRSNPGTLLFFPSGVYDFIDEKAVQLMNDAMSGKLGKNPQGTIFTPYYPYVKGLDFNGLHDISVEAGGAVLLCDGWLEPVSLNNCKNIKLSGLTINYKRKPHSAGRIVDVEGEWFDADFDTSYPVDSTLSVLRMAIWDVKAHRILPHENYFPESKVIAPQKLRIFKKIDPEMKGNLVLISHCFHFRPAVLIYEAENVTLEDVTIHSQPGMGITGHRSKDIKMTGLRIVPEPGCVQSTNTDATHFTSCTGLIRYENCQFEGQGDDGANIHNYYYTLRRPETGKGINLVLEDADWHAQVLDYPDPGDTLELVCRSTLAVVKKFAVKTVKNNFEKLYSGVTLNGEIPSDIENYYLINVTRLPRVEITGCTFAANRARGILIKTRNVLIERCLIRESTGTGIQVGAEGSWHEGPVSENVIIRYNRIIRCGTGPGTIDNACGITVSVGAQDTNLAGLHKHILIEGNIIEGENFGTGIYISGSDDVTIRNNEIAGCVNPLTVRYSSNVHVYSNKGIKDIL